MQNIALFIQIGLATTLTILVLVQSRGTGLARSSTTSSFSRRGLEKIIFKATFVVSALFIVASILQLYL